MARAEIVGLDHVQLAMPAGQEEVARAFYCGLLGMAEQPKPQALRGRGGLWLRAGACGSCRDFGRCLGNSLHLWDEAAGGPAFCSRDLVPLGPARPA